METDSERNRRLSDEAGGTVVEAVGVMVSSGVAGAPTPLTAELRGRRISCVQQAQAEGCGAAEIRRRLEAIT